MPLIGQGPDADLVEAIRARLRAVPVVQRRVELLPFGDLERSEHKARLVER